jgi:hypothetical protein
MIARSRTLAFPLPEGWAAGERHEDVVEADGLRIYRVGLTATRGELEAIGAAASVDAPPVERAEFERLERIALLDASRSAGPLRTRRADDSLAECLPVADVFPASDAPSAWSYARSNGVALQSTFRAACDAAQRELVERDRILRAWLGQTTPRRVSLVPASTPATRSYEWSAYLFPPPDGGLLESKFHVVGMFGFSPRRDAPLAMGFAARLTPEAAQTAAASEALQSLAFLWGEPLPKALPEPTPTPMCHLETWQLRDRHVLLRRWLEGAHVALARPVAPRGDAAHPTVRFVDLTPPWLEGGLRVVRAISERALPLAFGLSPWTAHLAPELRIHPIA